MAARIGRMFYIDPVVVLSETDVFTTHVRVACAKVIDNDERKQAEKNKAGSGRRARRR